MTSRTDLLKGCAVVTGAGSGVGAAIATYAAEELGMPVAVLDLSRSRAEVTAATIRAAGGVALAHAVDVCDLDAMVRVAADVADTLGSVSLLVANAGIEHSGLLWTIPQEQWRRVQDVNVNGMFNTVRVFLPPMIDVGRRRHVVCVASIGALTVRPAMGAYIVSKHATLALGDSLALDVASVGADIGVSVLLPGPVATRIADDALVSPSDEAETARRALAQLLDTKGLQPREIARITFAGIAEDRTWIHTHPELAATTIASLVGKLEAGLHAEG